MLLQEQQQPSSADTFGWSDFLGPAELETSSSSISYAMTPSCASQVELKPLHASAMLFRSTCEIEQEDEDEPTSVIDYTATMRYKRRVIGQGMNHHHPRHEMAVETATAAPTTSTENKQQPKKSVSFASALQVRTYNVILGDHPCCVGGMALQCDWQHDGIHGPTLVDLDIHEEQRRQQRGEKSPRQLTKELRLSYGQRRQRLQQVTGLSGAQLLQLEYELVCCSNVAAPAAPTVTSSSYSWLQQPQQQQSCSIQSFGRPLHHASSLYNLVSLTACSQDV